MKIQNWSKMAMDREARKRDGERAKSHRVVETKRSIARRSQETDVIHSPFWALLSTTGNYTHDVVGHNNMTFL